MKMAQLGKAVGILMAHQRVCDEMHEDVDAFHAPSECHEIVSRGNARRFRLVKKHACVAAGVKDLKQLRKAVKKACPTWDRYNHFRLGVEGI
jgi:hypothetical protein